MDELESANKVERTVGAFQTEAEAKSAYDDLQISGFPIEEVSLEAEELSIAPPLSWTKAGKSGKAGATIGGLIGLNAGLLLAAGAVTLADRPSTIPSFSPILVLLGSIIVGALAGGLIGALQGMSIRKPQMRNQQSVLPIHAVTVTGTPAEATAAEEILHSHQVET
ncbi:MAG: hypothetical protein KME17_28560 [Cyanosarcina radialis HA8281-LM2]|jgi:hypothetical protein|nr:hypothetical protein [Cyanosarcina radialis HA8281-LM2]